MKTIRRILQVLCMLLGFLFIAYPFIYWIQHPDLTYMQVFIKHWYLLILGYISFYGYEYIVDYEIETFYDEHIE